MKRYLRMIINSLRRKLVNKLLGNELFLEKKYIDSGYQLQLVDTKRRIPYGYWQVEELNERDTMLTR